MTPFLWKLVLRCLSVGFLAMHDRSAFEKQNFTLDTLEIQALRDLKRGRSSKGAWHLRLKPQRRPMWKKVIFR
jgi:hypothetical protein